MKETLKALVGSVVSIAKMILLCVVAILFLRGSNWVLEKALPLNAIGMPPYVASIIATSIIVLIVVSVREKRLVKQLKQPAKREGNEVKPTQRKNLVGVALLGALFLFLGGHFLWKATTHHGPGVWQFGGEEPGGGSGTDLVLEVVPERQYRRYCYCASATFLFLGGFTCCVIVEKWRKPGDTRET